MQPEESAPKQANPIAQSSTSNWKRIALTIILSAILVGTGGYLLGTNQRTSQSTEKASFQPSPTITPTSLLDSQRAGTVVTPLSAPTVVTSLPLPTFQVIPQTTSDGWVSYYDGDNEFALKYPSTWNQFIIGNQMVSLTPFMPEPPFRASETFRAFPGVSIAVLTNDAKLNATDFVLHEMFPSYGPSARDAKIKTRLSNFDGVIVTGLVNPISGEDIGPSAYVVNDSKVIIIESHVEEIKGGAQLFDKMLSTLQVW